jgi:hypothetical protein
MQYAYRTVSPLAFLLFFASICWSGCSPTPYAQFQPGGSRPVERTARITAPSVTTAPTDLSVSLAEVPVETTQPAWTTAAVPTTPAIRTEVRRPNAWSRVKRLLPRKPVPPGCDQIVLRNGDVIEAKVKEVGVNEIRYKKCDRQDGPDYTISKRDILSIKYSNGEVERFNASSTAASPSQSNSSNNRQSYDSPTNQQNDGPRTDAFAIVAISAGGLAVLTGLGSFLFAAVAVVFGAMSISRIRKQPGRYKGKGLAVAGMVLGIVAAGFWLLYIYVL